MPSVSIRTGDTPAAERARFRREPSDILITTPESIYLLLTSNARDTLRSVDTVIVDKLCRNCGTSIACRKQGFDARVTYWCPHCQPDRRRIANRE